MSHGCGGHIRKVGTLSCFRMKAEFVNLFSFLNRCGEISSSGRSRFVAHCGQRGGRLPLHVICSGKFKKKKRVPCWYVNTVHEADNPAHRCCETEKPE